MHHTELRSRLRAERRWQRLDVWLSRFGQVVCVWGCVYLAYLLWTILTWEPPPEETVEPFSPAQEQRLQECEAVAQVGWWVHREMERQIARWDKPPGVEWRTSLRIERMAAECLRDLQPMKWAGGWRNP